MHRYQKYEKPHVSVVFSRKLLTLNCKLSALPHTTLYHLLICNIMHMEYPQSTQVNTKHTPSLIILHTLLFTEHYIV